MTTVDWTRYQKCQQCFAELGRPCFSQTGSVAVLAVQPHSRRKLRKGYGRG